MQVWAIAPFTPFPVVGPGKTFELVVDDPVVDAFADAGITSRVKNISAANPKMENPNLGVLIRLLFTLPALWWSFGVQTAGYETGMAIEW